MIRRKRTQAVYRWHAIDERAISPMNTQGTHVFQRFRHHRPRATHLRPLPLPPGAQVKDPRAHDSLASVVEGGEPAVMGSLPLPSQGASPTPPKTTLAEQSSFTLFTSLHGE